LGRSSKDVVFNPWWGLENGAKGDWPEKERHVLEMQLGHTAGWTPEDVLGWILEDNLDGPQDRQEMEESLLLWLKQAKNPKQAAGYVLSEIWNTLRSRNPLLWTS
jgi:hypothetical protein